MNWNLIGHKNITDFFEKALKNDNLSHAYLFLGPKHIGKRTLAKKLISNILCYHEEPTKKNIPCGICIHCQELNKKTHPDVYWIKKETDKKNITVEQIRNLEDKLKTYSILKNYKIIVIENIENLNLASANSLLKTLEEPTKKTTFILTASTLNNLPKTIASRTQVIKFKPVPTQEIVGSLTKLEPNNSNIKNFATISFGKPGLAILFLENKIFWDNYAFQLNNFVALTQSKLSERIKFAEKLTASEKNIIQKNKKIISLINFWQIILRDWLLIQSNLNSRIVNFQNSERFEKISTHYNLKYLVYLQNELDNLKISLAQNVNPRLALENFLIKL